jgi:hypothetical protein
MSFLFWGRRLSLLSAERIAPHQARRTGNGLLPTSIGGRSVGASKKGGRDGGCGENFSPVGVTIL